MSAKNKNRLKRLEFLRPSLSKADLDFLELFAGTSDPSGEMKERVIKIEVKQRSWAELVKESFKNETEEQP